MSLQDISVKVESTVLLPDQPTGMAKAIVREVLEHARRLAQGGERQVVDLKGLPLTTGDLAELEDLLGRGEVTANVDAAGPTEVFETRYPGVWWVRYQNLDGHSVAEQLEVTRIPAILETHPDDVQATVERLEALVSSLNTHSAS